MRIHTPARPCFIIPSSMLRTLAVRADAAERARAGARAVAGDPGETAAAAVGFQCTLTVGGTQVRFRLDAAPAPLREHVGILEARPPD